MLHYSGDNNEDRLPAEARIYPILEDPIQINEDTVEISFRLCDPFVCNLYSGMWNRQDTNLVEWTLSDFQSIRTSAVPGNYLYRYYSW